MLNRATQFRQFSVDTESEISNYKLTLVQVQSIPDRLPFYIIFIGLYHLPPSDSHMYAHIGKFFESLFRSEDQLYAGQNMHMKLNPLKHLIAHPILADVINIQTHYNTWHERARILCRAYRLINPAEQDNYGDNDQKDAAQSPYLCHQAGSYGQNQSWSLRNALFYGCGLVVNEEYTLRHMSASLTSTIS